MSQPAYPKNSELGALQASYETNPAHARDLLGFIVLFALAGLVVLVIGVMQNEPRDQLPVIAGGVLLLAVGVRIYFAFRGRMNMSAAVYDDGLIVTNRRRQPIPCRWDDVTEVYETITYSGERMNHPRWWAYTVQQSNGQSFRLDNAIKQVKSLGLTIQREVDKRLLPRMIETYKAGETVTFGPHIGLNRQGLEFGSTLLPWAQVKKITFSQLGNLQIQKKGYPGIWKTIVHTKIANYPTCRVMLYQAFETSRATMPPIVYEDGQHPAPATPPATPSTNIALGGIGAISAQLGVDVRDLFMEGYTMEDIQGVLQGDYSLEEMPKSGRGSRPKK